MTNFCEEACLVCPVREFVPELKQLVGEVALTALKRSSSSADVRYAANELLVPLGYTQTTPEGVEAGAKIARAAQIIALGSCEKHRP